MISWRTSGSERDERLYFTCSNWLISLTVKLTRPIKQRFLYHTSRRVSIKKPALSFVEAEADPQLSLEHRGYYLRGSKSLVIKRNRIVCVVLEREGISPSTCIWIFMQESASVPLSREALQALILAEGRRSDTCQQRANYWINVFRPLGITGQGSAYQRPFFWHNTHLAECMATLNLKQACIVI